MRIGVDDVALIPLFWAIQATLTAPRVVGLAATVEGMTRSRYAFFR